MHRRVHLLSVLLLAAVLAAGCSTITDSDSSDPVIETGDGSAVTAPRPTESPSGDGTTDDSTTGDGATDDGTSAGDGTTDDGTTSPIDPDLVWTVVAVEREDVLNVRADPDPGAPVVGTLAPWTTGVHVTGRVDVDRAGTWRTVRLDDGTEGWVNSRFLVAQPAVVDDAQRDQLLTRTAELVAWTGGGAGTDGTGLFADRALWVGGLGIYGDGVAGWNWFPSDDVDRPADWDRVRTFDLGPDFAGHDCGADCEKSLNDFIDFGRVDGTSRYVLDDIPPVEQGRGFLDGLLWQAPESLHRVVIDTPASDPDVALDWQRIHVVYDWSGGEPAILLINTHGWTP